MFQKSLKFSLFLLLLAATKANAQNVAINADGANPDSSAMLDVQSTSKGMLIPRVTKMQRDAITNPATGLLIYQTDNTPGFYYYQGASSGGWVRLSTFAGGTNGLTGGWALNGNSGTGGTAFLGTMDYQALVFKTNNNVVGKLNASGDNSGAIAFGASSSAAQNGLALGNNANASGNQSVAIGTSAQSSTQNALAIGKSSQATQSEAIAIGTEAISTGYQAIAIGYKAEANSSSDAIALGNKAKASAYKSIAIGDNVNATQQNTIILGNNAQVGINTNTPAASAMLEITSNQKGVLIPRLNVTQRNNIGSPAVGLLIYQTDNTPGFYYYQGTDGGWTRLTNSSGGGAATGWSLSGNNVTDDNAFIGTTSYKDLVFKTNNNVVGKLNASGDNSGAIAFGASSSAAQNGLALGNNANASGNQSVAIGTSAQSSTQNALAIGKSSQATQSEAIAIGTEAISTGYQAIAIGYKAKSNVNSSGSVAIGRNAVVNDNIQNAVALGNGAVANKSNAIILGNTSDAQVGIGTFSPIDGVKLDVNGTAKLGANGSVLKNIITGSGNSVYSSLLANGSTSVIITLNSSASTTKASVSVSPGYDLPDGIVIAWARMTGTNQVTIRLLNTTSTGQSFNRDWYVTVTELN